MVLLALGGQRELSHGLVYAEVEHVAPAPVLEAEEIALVNGASLGVADVLQPREILEGKQVRRHRPLDYALAPEEEREKGAGINQFLHKALITLRLVSLNFFSSTFTTSRS